MTALQPASVRAGVTGTVLAHGGLIALMLFTAHHAVEHHELVYEVNLVAAPPPATVVKNVAPIETPTAPDDVAPTVKPKHVDKAPPKKVPPPPPPNAKHVEVTPKVTSPVAPAQGEKPSTGHDAVTLQQPGIPFPFPEYLTKIVNEIYARWDHTLFRPGFDAQIAFVILKDGSVNSNSIEVVKSSGNYSFDLNARRAIEAAGNLRAFGPLPSGFNSASLPIVFDFTQVAKGQP
ncbi:MAG TPA: TonB C-terminal domain-containing protein [Gemmatimonadales bacterium]